MELIDVTIAPLAAMSRQLKFNRIAQQSIEACNVGCAGLVSVREQQGHPLPLSRGWTPFQLRGGRLQHVERLSHFNSYNCLGGNHGKR